MVTIEDTGKRVIIRAADDFYAFVNGWIGILNSFDSGYGVVHVYDDCVDVGFKQFLVPPDQLEIAP